MAPVKCSKCSSEVAPQAAACTECGTPVSKPGLSTKQILLVVIGGLSVCCFGTCGLRMVGSAMSGGGSSSPAGSASTSEAASARWVEITTLLSEYSDNEVRADSNFRNAWITTSGYVNDVGRDALMDTIFVTLGTGRRLEIPRVQCFFSEAEAKKAATLSKGMRVTVRGRVEGLTLNVMVRRCEFLSL